MEASDNDPQAVHGNEVLGEGAREEEGLKQDQKAPNDEAGL